MPKVTVHSLSGSRVPLPFGPALRPYGSATLSLNASELSSPSLNSLVSSGLVRIQVEQDDAITDGLEVTTRADLNAICVVDVEASAEVGDVITLTCAIKDLAGRSVPGQRQVFVQAIADSDDQGGLGETVSPIGSVINFKEDADGVPSSAWITTTPDGTFDFTVTDANSEGCAVKVSADGCLVRVVRLAFN